MQTIREACGKAENMNNQPREEKERHDIDRRKDKLQPVGG
jgi:hypothetical protein